MRGSAPNETNVFVDGTLVPLVYHFGGLSSVIPTEMLQKIAFYPGNFSAQYGRVVGGIVDVGFRNPKKKFHGMAQVDLIDARFVAEGPIFDTGWTFALGGRRCYVDLWLKPVLEAAGAGVPSTAPVYYDYQAILQKDLGKNQSFRFAFFGSDDRLEVLVKGVNASNPGRGGNISFGTAFYRFQGCYENRISNDTQLKVTAAVGKDAIAFQVGDNFFTLDSMPIMLRTAAWLFWKGDGGALWTWYQTGDVPLLYADGVNLSAFNMSGMSGMDPPPDVAAKLALSLSAVGSFTGFLMAAVVGASLALTPYELAWWQEVASTTKLGAASLRFHGRFVDFAAQRVIGWVLTFLLLGLIGPWLKPLYWRLVSRAVVVVPDPALRHAFGAEKNA